MGRYFCKGACMGRGVAQTAWVPTYLALGWVGGGGRGGGGEGVMLSVAFSGSNRFIIILGTFHRIWMDFSGYHSFPT